MQVEIKYINIEGMVSVLPIGDRIDRNLRFAKSKEIDVEPILAANKLLAEQAEASGHLVSQVFDVKPYTYGQKIAAAQKATQMQGGERIIDQNILNLELIVFATGKTKKEIEDLPSQVAQVLFEEVQFVSEPDPERLLFLLQSPTDGQETVRKPKK